MGERTRGRRERETDQNAFVDVVAREGKRGTDLDSVIVDVERKVGDDNLESLLLLNSCLDVGSRLSLSLVGLLSSLGDGDRLSVSSSNGGALDGNESRSSSGSGSSSGRSSSSSSSSSSSRLGSDHL